jgi:hypothetical protein
MKIITQFTEEMSLQTGKGKIIAVAVAAGLIGGLLLYKDRPRVIATTTAKMDSTLRMMYGGVRMTFAVRNDPFTIEYKTWNLKELKSLGFVVTQNEDGSILTIYGGGAPMTLKDAFNHANVYTAVTYEKPSTFIPGLTYSGVKRIYWSEMS